MNINCFLLRITDSNNGNVHYAVFTGLLVMRRFSGLIYVYYLTFSRWAIAVSYSTIFSEALITPA